ncbi:MAG TPA: D-alanyl-D-alanine carboxypeptidase family protein [Ruminiclostridium sp.]|nr:D-alanyl-D-alanine carboxypeptidase family protein [Ruminiclostridium sp.]
MRKLIKSVIFLFAASFTFTQISGLTASALWNPPTTPTCNAVLVVNADTNTIIYEKNQDQKIYPASITKLMTAIIVYDKFKGKLDTNVTVEKEDLDTLDPYASKAGLKVGEQLTIEQLLNCLLVKSGDDSANVLARVTGGSVDEFVASMNKKAKEIGLKNTHYANPHGLQDPDHFTTASDVYKLAKYAMKIDELAKIVAQPSYTLPATNVNPQERQFDNTNFLIKSTQKKYYFKYVKGIKTGSTTPAGKCLVSYAEKDGKTYYAVVMGGTDKDGTNTAFTETKDLYQWVFRNFDIKPLVKTTDTAAQVGVDLAVNKTKLLLKPQSQLNALVPDTYKSSDLKITIDVPQKVKAPIKKGQVIGKEKVQLLDASTGKYQDIGEVNLVSSENVDLSMPLYILSGIMKFFGSIWFKIVAVLLVILLIVYISLSVYWNKRKKMLNRRRMKKYKYR